MKSWPIGLSIKTPIRAPRIPALYSQFARSQNRTQPRPPHAPVAQSRNLQTNSSATRRLRARRCASHRQWEQWHFGAATTKIAAGVDVAKTVSHAIVCAERKSPIGGILREEYVVVGSVVEKDAGSTVVDRSDYPHATGAIEATVAPDAGSSRAEISIEVLSWAMAFFCLKTNRRRWRLRSVFR
jgi:hypothetical protein